MNPGKRYNGSASLELVRMAGIDKSVSDGLLEVKSVHTAKQSRRQGHASKLMVEVCEEADKAKVILVLTPEQFDNGPIGTQQLKNWYAQYGFNVIQEKPVLMCRDPVVTMQEVAEVLMPFQRPTKSYNIETDQVVDIEPKASEG